MEKQKEKTGIESHVLRYWEEELGLNIPRNEMGHRYYTDEQLKLFLQIKDLKESGFQLKAVRTLLLPGEIVERDEDRSDIGDEEELEGKSEALEDEDSDMENAKILRFKEEDKSGKSDSFAGVSVHKNSEIEMKQSEDKLAQFEQIIGDIVSKSLMANNNILGENISTQVSSRVSDKVIKEMDYLLRLKDEAEDERFKKLDETIRNIQKSGKEAVAAKETAVKRKKKKFFAKNK